jgi:hypothetical protein
MSYNNVVNNIYLSNNHKTPKSKKATPHALSPS